MAFSRGVGMSSDLHLAHWLWLANALGYCAANAAEVQLSELRQMAHYASAIERIFPEHRVTASLLYTSGPTMIELSDADLAAHKPV